MKKKIFWSILIILLLINGCILVLKPHYKIKNRLKKLSSFQSNNISNKPLGWLRVQGTNIDFPILYYKDIDDISDPTDDFGWNLDNNRKIVNRTVITSHNVLNVSSKPLIGNKNHKRFEQLMAYLYYDFVKDNKYIQYTINNKNYLFKIYGVSFQKLVDYDLHNLDKRNLTQYISQTKKKSYFKFNVAVDENDKLITLVTCTRFFKNSDYSFVVDARMVRKNELIQNYKVKEKSNYKKIKNILKGEDDNE